MLCFLGGSGYSLQKPPSSGLEGSGVRGGGADEGLKVEGKQLHLRKALRALQRSLKGASRGLQGA